MSTGGWLLLFIIVGTIINIITADPEDNKTVVIINNKEYDKYGNRRY